MMPTYDEEDGLSAAFSYRQPGNAARLSIQMNEHPASLYFPPNRTPSARPPHQPKAFGGEREGASRAGGFGEEKRLLFEEGLPQFTF